MQDFNNIRSTPISRADTSIDQGLKAYMVGVYNLMAIGLLITGVAAFLISTFAVTSTGGAQVGATLQNGVALSPFGAALYTSPLAYIVMFAPLIAVMFLSFKISTLPTSTARMIFFGYAALVGLSLSSIFLVYTTSSIVQTFFITAASFGALSLYGYTTKRDLRPIGAFLFMALIGLLLAVVVNLFMQSSGLQYLISIVGILIFAGLTAYDTQNIKEMYYEGDSSDTMGRKMIMGALRLYLDFINMFIFLLQFLNSNRN